MKLIKSEDKRVVIFEDEEVSKAYFKDETLSDYQIIGLVNDNDFLLKDHLGNIFSVPTIPLDAKHLEPFHYNSIQEEEITELNILWYVKPLIFGGSPFAKENIKKVDLQTHIGLVNWWNEKYQQLKKKED